VRSAQPSQYHGLRAELRKSAANTRLSDVALAPTVLGTKCDHKDFHNH
jgi:hypothetical protein